MPAIITLVSGPAIVTWNGHSYYTKGDVTASLKRESFKVEALGAEIDERFKSQEMDINFTPAGLIETMTNYNPYLAANIGKRVIDTASLKPLVIIPLEGDKLTFPTAYCSKIPDLRLKATDTLFGDMGFTAFGDPTAQPTAAAAFWTVASSTFSDTNFDETKLITDLYTAAFGSTPFNAIQSIDGFEVSITPAFTTIEVENYGKLNAILKSLTVTAKFKPANLAESDIETLMMVDNTGALRPGQSFSKNGTSLVISGSGGTGTLTVTIPKMGPKDVQLVYGADKLRQGEIMFTKKRSWTAGVADELITFAIA